MKSKYFIIIATVIITITVGFILTFNHYKKTNTIKPDTYNSEFEIYSLNDINISNSNTNLIFLDDLDGTQQEELIVKTGDSYSFNKFGEHTIKVLELTDNFITISIDGLAPTKKSGRF